VPSATHSPARKLAIVALARLSGIEEAARVAGAQARSVREWMADAGDRDPRLADWQAARDYAMEQQLRATIEGNAAKAFGWSKSAGVSQRNVDMAPRSAKDGPEAEQPAPPDPIKEQTARLDSRRQRLLACELDAELADRADASDHPDSQPPDRSLIEGNDQFLAWLTAQVDRLLAMPDAEVDAETERLSAIKTERLSAMAPQRSESTQEPVEPSEPAPVPIRPATAVSAPPERVPMVLDSGYGPDTWHPLERRDHP